VTGTPDAEPGTPRAADAKRCAGDVSRQLIEEAANRLCWRGYIESDDDDEIDQQTIEELTALVREGNLCCATPDCLADHWLARQQETYERSLPTWTCDCGTAYKLLPVSGGEEQFFGTADNGLLGDLIGTIHRDAKGGVKRSGACRDCGRRFADTIARRANPQETLF
jgi:hypothetical protein